LRTWVRLEVAGRGRDTIVALSRDLPRLAALGAAKFTLPVPRRRFWFGRVQAVSHPVLEEAALIRACPLFDAAWYVAANPEAFAGGALDPVFHYVLIGGPAGRDPGPWFDSQAYVTQYPEASPGPLQHAIRSGAIANANS
jgi:hypothetical protein